MNISTDFFEPNGSNETSSTLVTFIFKLILIPNVSLSSSDGRKSVRVVESF